MKFIATLVGLIAISTNVHAEELYQRTFSDGSTVKEFKRDGKVSKITIVYEGALQKSYASRGMFAHYAACQIAKFRNYTHFILLSKKQENKTEDELIVGVTSDASESIDTKGFKKYKGDFPVQELNSYSEMCEKLEPIYERNG